MGGHFALPYGGVHVGSTFRRTRFRGLTFFDLTSDPDLVRPLSELLVDDTDPFLDLTLCITLSQND